MIIKLFKLCVISITLFAIGIVVIFALFPGESPKDTKFGVTFSRQQAEGLGLDWQKTYTDILDDLGVKYVRLSAYWTDIESKQGEFNFEILDWQIREAKKRDAKVLLAIGRKLPRWPECHMPEWASGLGRNEQNEAVLDMLGQVIARYKNESAIWAWQVENEPLFPFGICPRQDREFFEEEVLFLRSLDSSRPIVTTDSGELSFWLAVGSQGDIFGTTMYKIVPWRLVGFISYDFLPPAFYRKKTAILKKLLPNLDDVIVVELQAEPWTAGMPINTDTLDRQFSRFGIERFQKHIKYAKSVGYSQTYLWGVEWWVWLKEEAGHPEFWEEAKRLFK
ncbi:MAG: beta-galactosidase [Candidatus Spechtbacterales bacterium]